ncbi:hypothetical protein H5410_056643 [Solanum commersonii]|uniref:Uncharacterized protein n=1 Tax=Solanum commersonii TaxID=4109 RepID=A0A9J5WMB7_SOLCO|nr:hypothetical protein H5410_056643 [Solanum commersonii]
MYIQIENTIQPPLWNPNYDRSEQTNNDEPELQALKGAQVGWLPDKVGWIRFLKIMDILKSVKPVPRASVSRYSQLAHRRRRRRRRSSALRRPPHVASPSRRSSAALPFCNLKGLAFCLGRGKGSGLKETLHLLNWNNSYPYLSLYSEKSLLELFPDVVGNGEKWPYGMTSVRTRRHSNKHSLELHSLSQARGSIGGRLMGRDKGGIYIREET